MMTMSSSLSDIIESWGLWMECIREKIVDDGDERWNCTMIDLTQVGESVTGYSAI